jgi:hypothetical protein
MSTPTPSPTSTPKSPGNVQMDKETEANKSKTKSNWADEVDDEDAKDVELDEEFEADAVEHPSIHQQASPFVASVVAKVKKVGTSDSEGMAIKALSNAVVKLDRENQTIRKLVHSTTIKSAAALDMAAHNQIEISDVRAIALHANRRYSKQLLEFSGDGLLERTSEANADPTAHLVGIIHQYFDLPDVTGEHIMNVHFLGRTRNMVARWSDFGPDSAFEAIIARSMSRGQRTIGIYARIAEARPTATGRSASY